MLLSGFELPRVYAIFTASTHVIKCLNECQYSVYSSFAWCALTCLYVSLAPAPPNTSRGDQPSEDLSSFLVEQGVPTAFLHSGVKPMQRLELLRQLRSGKLDVIVGVNLLREVRLFGATVLSHSRFTPGNVRLSRLRNPT